MLIRRRMMVESNSCPYITDGLIFWLDGMNRGGVTGEWKDLIGGKVITLYGCTESDNGVYFAGTTSSYGTYSGAISSNWATETLEVAVNGQTWKNSTLLCPPKIDNKVGIGMIFSSSSNNFWINLDGVSKQGYSMTNINPKRISASSTTWVYNGTVGARASGDNWGANTSGITYIGKRNTSTKPFKGTVHSIRIYNRQLTSAEMQANQAVDATRFNL